MHHKSCREWGAAWIAIAKKATKGLLVKLWVGDSHNQAVIDAFSRRVAAGWWDLGASTAKHDAHKGDYFHQTPDNRNHV